MPRRGIDKQQNTHVAAWPPERFGLDVATQFWFKAYIRGDCWEWRGPRAPNEYGRWNTNGKRHAAHRIAYMLVKGPIPPGLQIDHLCHHPWCVRPSHLEAVTQRTNILRGAGLSAQAARRTHCKEGHPLQPDPYRPGKRWCRTCTQAYMRRWWASHPVEREERRLYSQRYRATKKMS